MKKLSMIILAICLFSTLLAACSKNNLSDASSFESEETSIPESTEIAPVIENYDVGYFTVDLPEGWKAFPQSDIRVENDEEASSQDPSIIFISRDAEDEWELFSKAYIKINYYHPMVTVTVPRDWYVDVEDFSIDVHGAECREAFSGSQINVDGYRDEYIYLVSNKGQFIIQYPVEMDGEATGLSHEDPEVTGILDSLKIK